MSDFRVSPDGLTPLVDDDDAASSQGSSATDDKTGDILKESGFTLDELYKLCLTFYKEFDGKAVHLAYKDKLKLVAYIKQITYGKVDASKSPPPGYLDVVGSDRRREWEALGDLSKDDSKLEFCRLLDSRCPQVRPYIEAHRREKEEQERKRREEEERLRREEEERERQRLEEEKRRLEEEERQKEEQQRLQFKEAIFQQLEPQLRPLAAQQHPHNPQQQQVFLQQLQEHYYQQYMQQLYQQQQQQQQHPNQHNHQQQVQLSHSRPTMENTTEGVPAQDGTAGSVLAQDLHNLHLGDQDNAAPPNGDVNTIPLNSDEEQYPVISKASCWTRKNIKEFKKELATEKESVIKVGHGETVTVRVPTHQEGKYIFWEFATDSYDIGFGLYFEWTESDSNAISVHVSDSSEEEEEFEDEEGEIGKGDVERGSKDRGPPMDEIIPIYRRDCHQEVYAGSHKYPGRGIYLLKFDNSYSLFRSKTLYYRVYYTRDTQPGRTPPDAVES
ncbi:Golgi resident protein GCP60-like [Diadema antillarum]|uniref:Golgi resident protein GCP60-like n=1 Tax=Diadema antillarum TaxID=105358 RepID=UPI003A8A9EC8